MNPNAPVYLVDADVLMQAHRSYYGFRICPGFWDCLLSNHSRGRILSIDRVKAEITAGDALARWVNDTAPEQFFAPTNDAHTIASFSRLMGWVQASGQLTDAAKQQFARAADGWLAAYAHAHPNHVVVTMEARAPGAKVRVPLPTVCDEAGVKGVNTFEMLDQLGAKFVLEA